MASPDWLAVVAAAALAFALGGLWYSPALFARAWVPLAHPGKTLESMRAEQQGGAPGAYAFAFLASLVAAATIGWFAESLGGGATAGIRTGLYAAVGFVGTTFATTYLFGGRPWKLYGIDAGYKMTSLVLIGAVYGLWPW